MFNNNNLNNNNKNINNKSPSSCRYSHIDFQKELANIPIDNYPVNSNKQHQQLVTTSINISPTLSNHSPRIITAAASKQENNHNKILNSQMSPNIKRRRQRPQTAKFSQINITLNPLLTGSYKANLEAILVPLSTQQSKKNFQTPRSINNTNTNSQ